ncbi:uncharacterized protein LOC130131818 [Lampris incognitus]|uniref:uncharacterized protein LOC130131818 n=1 Tax=Lampris incognitus TaxID=2546036 RepID=UPI0024B54D8F|nr:uncharacterized protein LOC130131818 [Lampris incognitus]
MTSYTKRYFRIPVADLSGKEAVRIICSLETSEEDELLLALSRTFLSQQLHKGDMLYLWDLVFIWSKLHGRVNTSSQALLEESRQLMLTATNVNSIFPFIRVILEELGDKGLQFCVELCANALQSCLLCDAVTKSLIYKTIASLLPNDLEVCRACALLVFFLERTVEAYKVVLLLYTHPDQEYHAESSPIGNHIRFEILQILKKGLYFDPEFWNLIALRTSCLKLMSEKVLNAALEEIMDENWVSNYCAKDPTMRSNTHPTNCHKQTEGEGAHYQAAAKKHHHKETRNFMASKRNKMCPSKTGISDNHTVKKKRNQGSRSIKEPSSESFRRSFWQLDKTKDNFAQQFGYGEHRRITRLSEKNPPKRRIRTPRWLLEDSGTLENSAPPKLKKCRMKSKHQKRHRAPAVKKAGTGQVKNNAKHKTRGSPPKVPSDVLCESPDVEMKVALSSQTQEQAKVTHSTISDIEFNGLTTNSVCQITATVSQNSCEDGVSPATIADEIPETSTSNEVSNIAVAVELTAQSQDVVTTESIPRAEKSHVGRYDEEKSNMCFDPSELGTSLSNSSAANTSVANTPNMFVAPLPIAGIAKVQEPIPFDNPSVTEVSNSPRISDILEFLVTGDLTEDAEIHMPCNDDVNVAETDAIVLNPKDPDPGANIVAPQKTSESEVSTASRDANSREDLCALTLVTEIVTESAPQAFVPETEVPKEPTQGGHAPEVAELVLGGMPNVTCKIPSTSSGYITEQSATTIVEVQEEESAQDTALESPDNGDPDVVPQESEESKLEYCCTLCNKVFKGKRVVVHAMFHYRKDKCMFCGLLFKDDLLAMMHLSEHIEKLKKCKESAGNIAQENKFPQNKGITTPKTETSSSSSVNHRGRPRKSTLGHKTLKPSDSVPSESRKLRSAGKPSDNKFPFKHVQNMLKHGNCKSPVHKINGHICKSQSKMVLVKQDDLKMEAMQNSTLLEESSQLTSHGAQVLLLPETLELEGTSTPASIQALESCHSTENMPEESESLELLKTTPKQEEGGVMERSIEMLAKVCCPVDRCSWNADLSRNRVVLLYHALEVHYGNVKPLELAFQIGNNRCSICMRVLWSFQHYQHHVERHRLTPRHPCLHQGCNARFKTGIEMRRHTRRHSPLQAVCCLPGCSKLFICLWALNLHEREHYASKPIITAKGANLKTGNKCDKVQAMKKWGHKPKDAMAAQPVTNVDRAESVRNAPALQKQATEKPSKRNRSRTASLTTSKTLPAMEQAKVKPNSKDVIVTGSLSNKDTFPHPTNPTRRFRRKLSKERRMKKKLPVHSLHQVSSSIIETNGKMRNNFMKKKVTMNVKSHNRMGCRPGSGKLNKPVMGRKMNSHEDGIISEGRRDQKTNVATQLSTSPLETARASNMNNKSKKKRKERKQICDIGVVKTTCISGTVELNDNSKSQESIKQQVNESSVLKQKNTSDIITIPSLSPDVSKETVPPVSAAEKMPKSIIEEKSKKLKAAKKRSLPKDGNNPTAPSDNRKTKEKQKDTNTTEGPKIKKKCPNKERGTQSASKKHAKSKTAKTLRDTNEDFKSKTVKAEQDLKEDFKSKTTKAQQDTNEDFKSKAVKVQQDTKEDFKSKTTKAQQDTNEDFKSKTVKAEQDTNEDFKSKTVKAEQDTKEAFGLKTAKAQDTKEGFESKTAKAPQDMKEDLKSKTAKVQQDTEEDLKSKTAKDQQDTGEALQSKTAKAQPDTEEDFSSQLKLEVDDRGQSELDQTIGKGAEEKAEGEAEKTQEATSVSTTNVLGYSLIVNGQVVPIKPEKPQVDAANSKVEIASATPKETPSSYGKRLYIRPPPTAYLDERYTNMPKRRKEMSMFSHSSQNHHPPQQAVSPQQRQRCANCFISFSSTEELQSHLLLKKCSNLFGFDSDDEDCL